MTIYETMTGQIPYYGKHESNVVRLVTVKREPPERPKCMSSEDESRDKLWKLLVCCWSFEPTLRPNAAGVATAIKKIDWNQH
ncbi:unnamed protein product [Rhizoctonia solani]|uniref:Serine-threonine/tyrosine-protein kinase catalytic domain-containing protein n=1 Tax=Rhizoctonia solani TaxID=456999 RepID=A0A8H3CCZ2_9AGAM|nr:unnamed protein product [Rhizoctonia solani]